jgi:hypothetical protein
MARIARNHAAIVDLSSADGTHPNVWTSLVVAASGGQSLVSHNMTRLGFTTQTAMNGLIAFINPHRRKVLLLVHPLWSESHPLYAAARQVAETQHPGYAIGNVNPFRLLRRPADCL